MDHPILIFGGLAALAVFTALGPRLCVSVFQRVCFSRILIDYIIARDWRFTLFIRANSAYKIAISQRRHVHFQHTCDLVPVQWGTSIYISSFPNNAKRKLETVRKHWAIENKLHWILDVTLKEDHSRVRKDQASENFHVLRHIALNLSNRGKLPKRRHLRPTTSSRLQGRLSPQSSLCRQL